MRCPNCGDPTVPFPVPEAIRESLPDSRPGAALCPHCLTVTPVDDPPADATDVQGVSDALPTDPEAAATIGALLALIDSLALYRAEIDAVARHAESLGVDVMLVVGRLARGDDVDPHFDVDRRLTQLEQLLS